MSAHDRVTKFLAEWGRMRGQDPSLIYGLHSGDPARAADLTIEDLQVLLQQSAAAPDLLDALKAGVCQYGQPGGPWSVPNDPGGWLERSCAAIAKAEGKA